MTLKTMPCTYELERRQEFFLWFHILISNIFFYLYLYFFLYVSLETLSKWPNGDSYDNFAYHIELLVVFSSHETANAISASASSRSARGRASRRGTFRRVNSHSAKVSGGTMFMNGSNNSSVRSNNSVRSWRNNSTKNNSNKGTKRTNSTVQGSNVFASSLRLGRTQAMKADSSIHSR
jgi:hypothetical protein